MLQQEKSSVERRRGPDQDSEVMLSEERLVKRDSPAKQVASVQG
jgi:hypothetical protein